MITYDIEFLVIYLALATMFFLSLRKRQEPTGGGNSFIDLDLSTAIKGIACIMILTAHWGNPMLSIDMPWGISKAVWYFCANIALVWFMFFSGYGLSLKKANSSDDLLHTWLKRLKKVYLPLLFVGLACVIGYLLLPSPSSVEAAEQSHLSADIYYLHHPSRELLTNVLPHTLGWKNWYVICIIYFYTFFYLSQYLERKSRVSQTLWLFLLMIAYYIFATWFYGKPEAHFYRYCWTFFGGHIVARWNTYANKLWPILLTGVLCSTIFFESVIMWISYSIAVAMLLVFSRINQRYIVSGRAILFLGGISYFVYLIHGRLGFALMVYSGTNSIILWTIISIIIAWLTKRVYRLVVK